MKYTKRLLSALLALCLVLTLVPLCAKAQDVTRLYGSTRYGTAFAIADTLKAQMGGKAFDAVIVSSGEQFADALAGSYLAAVKNAPILLVKDRNKEINAVKDYIKTNVIPGGTVYLLGGDKAVPSKMESGLEGFSVKRLGGSDRYATNLLILQEAGVGSQDIVVCTGKNFADSLSVSAAGLPILLVKSSLNNQQKDFLTGTSGRKIIIGGKNAVSEKTEKQLTAYGEVSRLAGSTRYETSVLVAKEFFKVPKQIVLAYAENFPDGLCGGPLANQLGAPLILTAAKKEQQADTYADSLCIQTGFVTGGSKLISDSVCNQIFTSEHTWSDWVQTKTPTIDAEGEESRSCSKCALTETQPVEKLPTPTEPEPTEPEPTEPEPTEPEPTEPEPTEPEPTEPEPTPATVLSAEKDAALRADLQSRISEILNTETEIIHSDTYIPGKTYTGKAYYISADGDDNNDGLSPESAWQTPSKLLQELDCREGSVMQPGDAIFLRRGDTFRLTEWSLDITLDQVTISAYGEGEKPIITCSTENGAGADKWELVNPNDTSGKKIWKYYRDMKDISMIVLGDGEAIATRFYEFYDGTGYVSCTPTGWCMHDDWMNPNAGVTLKNGLLSPEESLTKDLTLISRPERYGNNYSESGVGPLYLRCDSGNPGEIYDSIEFSEYIITGIIWLGGSNVLFDNLSLRCNGNSLVKGNGFLPWQACENTVFQNCEFAYCGGNVTDYLTTEGNAHIIGAQGDGIYCVVNNFTMNNCYFHDSISSITTYETSSEKKNAQGYYHILDSVFVNTSGIRLDSTFEPLKYLDSVIIRGNHIWNTGRLDRGKVIYSEGSLVIFPNHYGECIVEDNVIYGTENGYETHGLLNIWFHRENEDTVPQLRNNTYVQYKGQLFANFYMEQDQKLFIDDPHLRNKAAKILGDTTSRFYVIP